MNKQALKLLGLSKESYIEWCKENKKPVYSKKSDKEFCKKQLKKLKLGGK